MAIIKAASAAMALHWRSFLRAVVGWVWPVVNLQGRPGLKAPVLSAMAAASVVRPNPTRAKAQALAQARTGPNFAVIQQYRL